MSDLQTKIQEECKRHFLQKYSFKVPEDWLTQCSEFVLETFPNETIIDYRNHINKQLLDFDLNEIGSSCLPEKLFSAKNGAVNGTYLLQINVCFDSNQSFYNQIQELTGTINENALIDADIVPSATQFEKKDSKKNRVLTFILSDGSKTVKAIEYHPISSINQVDLLPGTKVVLKGQINFFNQTLHLSSGNLEVLGGQVPEIGTLEYMIQILQNMILEKNEQTSANKEKSKKFEHTPIITSKDAKYKSQTFTKKEPYSQNATFKLSQKINSSACNKQQLNKENIGDDEDDDLLSKIDFTALETKNAKTLDSKPPENKISNKRQPSETNTLTYYQANISHKKIKTETNEHHVQDKQVLAPITNHNINSSKNQFKVSNDSPKNYSEKDQVGSSQEDNILLLNCDFKEIKPTICTNTKTQATLNSSDKLTVNSSNISISKESKNSTKNTSPEINFNKLKDLNGPINYEVCCVRKKPNIIGQGEENFSLCIHIENGFIKEFTNKLVQSKLKWSQECVISDLKFNVYEAYLGNEPIEMLLDLTCLQAKEIFKKSKEINKPPEENEYVVLFEKKKNEYFDKTRESGDTNA